MTRLIELFRRFRLWIAAEDHLHGRVLAASVAGVLAMTVLALVFLAHISSERRIGRLRESAIGTLRTLDKIEGDVAMMEAAHRDFVVTGERAFLDQFRRRTSVLESRFGELEGLLQHPSPAEAVRAKAHEDFKTWENEVANPMIAEREQTGRPPRLSERQWSRTRLDGIRSDLAYLGELQANAFAEATDLAERHRLLQTSGVGVLCFLAIGFLITTSCYSFAAFRRHIRKVEQAEEQVRAIIAATLDGVVTFDEGGTIHWLNPAAERMFGFPVDQAVGASIATLFPERPFLDEVLKLGGGTVMALAERTGGASFPVELSVSAVSWGGSRYFVAILRDITERHRHEETLKNIGLGVSAATGAEFVNSLVVQLSRALQLDGAFVIEVSRDADRAVHTMTIAEQEQICGSGPCDLTGTAAGEALASGFQAYLSGVQHHFPADWLLAAFGAESFVAMPLVDHLGQIVGLMGVLDHRPLDNAQIVESTLQIFAARAAAEIERKRYAEDLATEKEQLAVTLSSIGDGVVTIDNDGRVRLMNEVAERLTGWPQRFAIGARLNEVFKIRQDRSRRSRGDESVLTFVESGIPDSAAGPAYLTSRDGTESIVEASAAPIRDQNERQIGTVLVFRDVTERQRMLEERQKAEKLESLGVAAGGIAHDFNNLLTAILGNLSLALYSRSLDEPTSERLTAAKKASLRAQELAQQLLTFAKGGAPIKHTASVSQLVCETVDFSLRGSNVRCEFDIAPDLWPAEVDTGQISQVIQNLAINAEQAMPAGGTLKVSCSNVTLSTGNSRLGLGAGRYLKITVHDEGIGIAAENLQKIFDPYFTTKPKGSGLGLATSYSIIRNHGGAIDVVSAPGAGTTFYVFLPATDKAVQPEEKVITPAPVLTGSGSILVLDDEKEICELVACALEPLGYEVVTTQDAASAISAYQSALDAGQRFDLVISDLTIPGGMGGIDALKRLREIDPDVRAIVSSGYAMDPVMSRYRDYGFCAMIAKPYEIDTLTRVIAEVMNSETPAPAKVIRHHFGAA